MEKICESNVLGSLFGMALGDGYGYLTEFLTVQKIIEKWPPNGPSKPEGTPILVSDDTQMSLSVAQALINSWKNKLNIDSLEKELISQYVLWLNDAKNNRAPGMTCLRACEKLEKETNWLLATEMGSKGCGANMRVIPVGLLITKGVKFDKIAEIAQFQSAITHGHPTALAASEITAITIAMILSGINSEDLLGELMVYVTNQRNIYRSNLLKELWDRPPFHNEKDFINSGWDEVAGILGKVKNGLEQSSEDIDPCSVIGQGWIAEESFGTALFCFLLNPKDPVKMLKRAVVTNGDSDSIACLAGAFGGAYNGIESFPVDWTERIEYRSELLNISKFYLE